MLKLKYQPGRLKVNRCNSTNKVQQNCQV